MPVPVPVFARVKNEHAVDICQLDLNIAEKIYGRRSEFQDVVDGSGCRAAHMKNRVGINHLKYASLLVVIASEENAW